MRLEKAFESGRPRKRPKRLGRGPGSGHGKSSGRGWRGATARQGWHANFARQGGQMPLFRRLPKRGFNNAAFRLEHSIVNVCDLSGFEAGAVVGPAELAAKELVVPGIPVKVLGNGKIEAALTVRAHRFSKSAAQKIEAAGGRAEVI
jgi:large subunit ribosomal protein L15